MFVSVNIPHLQSEEALLFRLLYTMNGLGQKQSKQISGITNIYTADFSPVNLG
jgi:hypothetical protein